MCNFFSETKITKIQFRLNNYVFNFDPYNFLSVFLKLKILLFWLYLLMQNNKCSTLKIFGMNMNSERIESCQKN